MHIERKSHPPNKRTRKSDCQNIELSTISAPTKHVQWFCHIFCVILKLLKNMYEVTYQLSLC